MALTLLQPGMEPLGQFDLADGVTPVGGECATFGAAAGTSTADDWAGLTTLILDGPQDTAPTTGSRGSLLDADGATALTGFLPIPELHGLVDDGATGYGTLFGTVIGGTAGQGTGLGATPGVGVVVVGPNTNLGSGKVTLWDKPGLYGASQPAWVGAVAANADGAVLNSAIYAVTATSATALAVATGATAGELCSNADTAGCVAGMVADGDAIQAVGLFVGTLADSSLVSTSNVAAGVAAVTETHAIYFFGNGGAR
jgi:hypothetical protein